MKTLLISLACAMPAIAADGPSERLLDALVMVESSGRKNPPRGDGGRAVGPLQIHAAVVSDVNRIYKTRYTHAQCSSLGVSREICRLYLSYYCTASRLGRKPTDADFSRTWNGGPTGHRKAATLAYWRKVKAELERRPTGILAAAFPR